MAEFRLRDVHLVIPDAQLTPPLTEALIKGRYEGPESDALLRHLRPGDRLIDLGAGAGYLCALAANVLGANAVLGVEAGPDMAPVARANLVRNGHAGATLLHGAVVGADHAGDTVTFGTRRAFWASSLMTAPGALPEPRARVTVPALRLPALLADHPATVLSCDIEGAELEVLATDLPGPLRLIVVELHPNIYGQPGVARLFAALATAGFAYQPEGSRGPVVVFERLAGAE